MARNTFVTSLNTESLAKVIKELEDYKVRLKQKVEMLCLRLAEIGAVRVSLGYARAIYSGKKDISVVVEAIPNGYAIVANGEALLFCEFGTGVTYGYGHPEATQYGMGPGTYPDSKGHWDNPKGWWLPKEKGGGHTYGNPPNAVMYRTARELEQELVQIAREVFSG